MPLPPNQPPRSVPLAPSLVMNGSLLLAAALVLTACFMGASFLACARQFGPRRRLRRQHVILASSDMAADCGPPSCEIAELATSAKRAHERARASSQQTSGGPESGGMPANEPSDDMTKDVKAVIIV